VYRTNSASERLWILGTVGKREREDRTGPEKAGSHTLPGTRVEKVGGGIEEEKVRAGKAAGAFGGKILHVMNSSHAGLQGAELHVMNSSHAGLQEVGGGISKDQSVW
jgi:hypothetical protein